jgi:regulator of sigma E protease
MQYVVSFLVVLAIVIVVHEFGHYWIARLCGVKVLRFSVGFGRPLLKWTRGPDHTEWVIALVPLGGYVRMLDEREGPVEPGEAARAFNRQSVWKRIAIVAAGPIANFVLALGLYAATYMNGFMEPKALLGTPAAGTPAEQAGFRDKDEILSINGKPIRVWQDVRWELIDIAVSKGVARIEVSDAANRIQTRALDVSGTAIDTRDGDPLTALGLRLYRPPLAPVLGVVESGKPAASAGLRTGDRILAIDGTPINDWSEFVRIVVASPNKALALVVERDGARQQAQVTPAAVPRGNETIGRVGAGPREDPEIWKNLYVQQRYGLGAALVQGAIKTWEMSIFSVRMLWKMVTGSLSWRNLSGPLTIADYAGQSASLGWIPFVTFIALVSISIGVLNLLPIPILDGGHLMYYAVELIKGSPLSERVMEFGQRVGLAILLVLMGFAFYNDITRQITRFVSS